MAFPLLAIQGAAKVAGSIIGGASAAKAYKQNLADIEAKKQENQLWFDRKYNEDALQRRTAQALLNQQEQSIRNRNRIAQSQAAVMGGSQATIAAQKQANNEALASTANVISLQDDARKDRIEDQYMQTRDNLDQQITNARMAKAQNIANTTRGLTNSLDKISPEMISEIGALFKKKKRDTPADEADESDEESEN